MRIRILGPVEIGFWSVTDVYATGGRDPGLQGQEEGGGQGQGQDPPSYILKLRFPNKLESRSELITFLAAYQTVSLVIYYKNADPDISIKEKTNSYSMVIYVLGNIVN